MHPPLLDANDLRALNAATQVIGTLVAGFGIYDTWASARANALGAESKMRLADQIDRECERDQAELGGAAFSIRDRKYAELGIPRPGAYPLTERPGSEAARIFAALFDGLGPSLIVAAAGLLLTSAAGVWSLWL